MSDDAKAKNRARFPFAAGVMDDLRAVFGDVKLIYAEENGQSVGTPMPLGVSLTRLASLESMNIKARGKR